MTGSTSRSELRALARIPEAPARSLAVGERLARLGREGFTIAFDALAHGAARGHIEDVIAMLACARFFQRERASGPDRDLEAMRESARRAGLRFATAILEPASDARALGWRGRLRDVGGPSRLVRRGVLYIPPTDEDDRRSMAAYLALEAAMQNIYGPLHPEVLEGRIASFLDVWKEDLLSPAEEAARAARLAELGPTKMWVSLPPGELRQRRHLLIRRAMVPDVLRRLLREPDLSPKEVLTIAARRPSSPAIVDELCASPWLDRIEVRSALALNPFTPTATALMLVPTCRSRLRQVLRANVHPRVNALARMCLDARDGCPRERAPLSERSDSDE